MSDVENVVFLAVSNKDAPREPISTPLICCKACKNKTFILISPEEDFVEVRCAACSVDIGKVGWTT